MLSYLDLKRGTQFVLDDQPYETIDSHPMRKAQDVTVIQVTAKNLITGNVIERTFHKDDRFEEAGISKLKAKYIFSYKNKYTFCEASNPSNRF